MPPITVILVNLSQLIFVIGFLIKDILWLRLVMIIGASVEIGYFTLLHDHNNVNVIDYSIAWDFVWVLVNAFQLTLLIKAKMNLRFTVEENKLKHSVFSKMPLLDLKTLLKTGTWHNVGENVTLIEENKTFHKLLLIYEGTAAVEKDNNIIAYIRDGGFAGEISFLTGNPTTAKVVTLTPLRYISWEKKSLIELMKKNPEINSGIYRVFNSDLIKKLNVPVVLKD